MQYSQNFERDYNFYLKNKDDFIFCGTMSPKFTAIYNKDGLDAKSVFYSIESKGKNLPCSEPVLLDRLLLCKASVNFQIKQWAQGRAEGTLPFIEFAGDGKTLEWQVRIQKNKYFGWMPVYLKRLFKIEDKRIPVPIYKSSIKDTFELPDWVITAVENQKQKILNNQQTILC